MDDVETVVTADAIRAFVSIVVFLKNVRHSDSCGIIQSFISAESGFTGQLTQKAKLRRLHRV